MCVTHSLLYLCWRVAQLLKEELSVVPPHIPSSISNTSSQTEHEHTGHKERLEEQHNTFLEGKLLLGALRIIHGFVLSARWFLYCEQHQWSHCHACCCLHGVRERVSVE